MVNFYKQNYKINVFRPEDFNLKNRNASPAKWRRFFLNLARAPKRLGSSVLLHTICTNTCDKNVE